jgi:hypothetical protein
LLVVWAVAIPLRAFFSICFFRLLAHGSDSHVKYHPVSSFIGGCCGFVTALPDTPGFFFQIQLSPLRQAQGKQLGQMRRRFVPSLPLAASHRINP